MNQVRSEPTSSRAVLLDTAFDVVRHYREFKAYGSREKARKALRRRCPDFSARQYENAFAKAMRLFEVAQGIVDNNLDTIYELEAKPKFKLTVHFEPFYGELKKQCPGFKRSTYDFALHWILFWHYLK